MKKTNDILTAPQRKFLEVAGKNALLRKSFYLTGGTALAAFYLHHRYSEDLDFFSEREFDISSINTFLRENKKALGIERIDYQQSYNRNLFFLSVRKEILKAEFTFFPFPRIEKGMRKQGMAIDSLHDIAINKLFAIYQRTAARDFIDLYWICQEEGYTVAELTTKAKAKFDFHIDPLQLGAQFVKVEEVHDYPRMIKNAPSEMWQKFFIEEAKKLQKEIIA